MLKAIKQKNKFPTTEEGKPAARSCSNLFSRLVTPAGCGLLALQRPAQLSKRELCHLLWKLAWAPRAHMTRLPTCMSCILPLVVMLIPWWVLVLPHALQQQLLLHIGTAAQGRCRGKLGLTKADQAWRSHVVMCIYVALITAHAGYRAGRQGAKSSKSSRSGCSSITCRYRCKIQRPCKAGCCRMWGNCCALWQGISGHRATWCE